MHQLVLEVEDYQLTKINSLISFFPSNSVKLISDKVIDKRDNFEELINTIKKDETFTDIKDAVQWQRDIRNEW